MWDLRPNFIERSLLLKLKIVFGFLDNFKESIYISIGPIRAKFPTLLVLAT